jgi:hypothetical protein
VADEEVFLYDAVAKRLVCASCNPSGEPPAGVFEHTRDEDLNSSTVPLVIDYAEIWPGRWLAANIPGWTAKDGASALYQSRYLSDNGRLYFNSADALSEQARNGKANVYQYEPEGLGDCHSSHCLSLISSGTATSESAFLDASAGGEDVFVLTAQQLVGADQDGSYDVYDAHVCTQARPCIEIPVPNPEPCESLEGPHPCRPAASPSPVFGPPSSVTPGPGNPPPHEEKLQKGEVRNSIQKKPTRAQLLAAALKKCKKKYNHSKHRRTVCERQARKKYGAKKASTHRSSKGTRK